MITMWRQYASMIFHSVGSENLVADAHAAAVGRKRTGQPIGPLLVLEVDCPEGDSFSQLDVDAAAVGDIRKTAVRCVVLKVHPAEADQDFGVGSGPLKAQPFDGKPGSDQVVVLTDVEVGIEAQPARLGFDLNPARELHIHIGAIAIEAVGAGLSDRSTLVVGLKNVAQEAGVDGKTLRVGGGNRLRARG